MRFLTTLHAYILREMLKTTALTVAALTILITLGGGIFNLLRFQGVSAFDFVGMLPFLLPVVFTLVLPVAALFAATLVYGRLAVDNELTACRAAGINIHRLFFTAGLLAVFIAAFGLLMGNFVLPGLVRPLYEYGRSNICDMALRQFQEKGFVRFRNYTLTAQLARNVSEQALEEKGFETGPGLDYLLLDGATLLELDNAGRLVRFSNASKALCIFDKRPNPLEVTLIVSGAQDFHVRRETVEIGEQHIGPLPFSLFRVPLKLSAADLRDLLHWRQAPWDAPTMRDQVARFLAQLTIERFYQHCLTQLQGQPPLLLDDDGGRSYRITAARTELDGRALRLGTVRVEVAAPNGDLVRYEAEQAQLKAHPLDNGQFVLDFTLQRTPRQDVLEYRTVAGTPATPRIKPTLSLDGLQMPPDILAAAQQFTAREVLDPTVPLPGAAALADQRASLLNAMRTLVRKLTATVHFREALLGSVLVTLLMGAALGILFRGAQVLAAFAVAMIPFFTIGLVLVLGQKLAEDARMTALGLPVMYGGLALVLLADLLIIRLGVRR